MLQISVMMKAKAELILPCVHEKVSISARIFLLLSFLADIHVFYVDMSGRIHQYMRGDDVIIMLYELVFD
jgi:hypothetical protein